VDKTLTNTAAYKRSGLGDFTGNVTSFEKPKDEENKKTEDLTMGKVRSSPSYTNTVGEMQRQNSIRDSEEPGKAVRVLS